MKKVAIWGSYNYGNFGDDLMAILFAKYLQELGVYPVVYRLDKSLAEKYNIGTTDKIEELISGALFSFVGGGSWLEKRKLGENYEADFKEYRLAIEAHGCATYALSIGGDLSNDMRLIEPERMAFFKSPQFKGASVRLRIDIEGMQALGKECEYYPDVVLSLPKYFPTAARDASAKKKVGLNFHVKDRKVASYINNIFSRLYPNVEYIYLQTHLPHFLNTYEYKYQGNRRNITNYGYTDIAEYLIVLSQLDIIITSKLHPGVSTLAYGNPFILFEGFNKTVAFLKSINSESANMSRWYILSILARNKAIPLELLYDTAKLLQDKEASFGHYKYLKKLVQRHA
jgi:polysaccharide pyruvyl transferase WcaK-like protein